ncbi:MAG: alpha/beta hydrolase [Panacagrimonas sp.]
MNADASKTQPTPILPSPVEAVVRFRKIEISRRSRVINWLLRIFLKPWMGRLIRGSNEKIAKAQLRLSGMRCPRQYGMQLQYSVIGDIPGHVIGDLSQTDKPLIVWLHGGAFVLPAAPNAHLEMVCELASELGAVAFVPDYRLAPHHRFPAGLDDCERAYGLMLDLGFDPGRIVIGGDSAGGNLTLGVLQRIRKNGWPMPSCALPVSPATEMGRMHGPPSRSGLSRQDPILPMAALQRVLEMYCGDWDASDPELSPLHADCDGFPPMYLLATNNEVLMDDSVLFARRAHAAGVDVRCEVWPTLPHAFPLFGLFYAEARVARQEMLRFMRQQLNQG